MRIILLLAATAIAGAAPAQSSAATFGHGGGKPAMRAPARPGHGFSGHFRPGRGSDFDRRHGRHQRRLGRGGGESFVYAFGAGGIDDDFEAPGPYGPGFFGRGSGEVRLRGGRAYYDYDRSYPYEWARAADKDLVWVVDDSGLAPLPSCDVEKGVRVCRGGR